MAFTDIADNRGEDTVLFRAELRRSRIAAREAMTAAEHRQASAAIEAHLAAQLGVVSSGVIAFCWPIRGEFDARPLVGTLVELGWRACQPVAEAAAAPMTFRSWAPGAPMAADRHGIPVPAEGDPLKPDVVLLPLVAFDEQGFRLGYGGGYFDRTLASLQPAPLAIGVGFELARTDSIRPGRHDIRLDIIVTEMGMRRFGAHA